MVATNARLTREQAQKVAQMGHNALARCIRPVHTLFDGDLVFVLAHPEVSADLHIVGVLAEAALEQAILGAVKSSRRPGSPARLSGCLSGRGRAPQLVLPPMAPCRGCLTHNSRNWRIA